MSVVAKDSPEYLDSYNKFNMLVPVPREMASGYSWQWQNIKFDLQLGTPEQKIRRIQMEPLKDWQGKANYWRHRIRNVPENSRDYEFMKRHLTCVEDIVAMLVRAKLEMAFVDFPAKIGR